MSSEKIYLPHSGDKSVKGRKRIAPGRGFVSFDSNVSTLTRMGIMRFQNQDFTSAEEFFSRALRELNPPSPSMQDQWLADVTTHACESDNLWKQASSGILASKHNSERTFQATILRNSQECDEGIQMLNEVIMFEDGSDTAMVTTTLQYNIAQSLLSKREHTKSIIWFQLSLVACSDPTTKFKALHNIGFCYYRIGNIERSLEHFHLSFPILSTIGLANSMTAALTSNCLAVLYFKMDIPQLEKSMKMFQRSLRIYHSNEQCSPIEMATLLNNIGRVYFLQGRYEKAKDVYIQSMQLRRHHLDSDSIDVAATSFNLGNTYQKLSRFEKALVYYSEFVRIGESKLGLTTREIAVAYKCIAEIYQEQKNPDAALQNYERALEAAKSSMGDGHREIGCILNRAGNLCFECGKFDEALKYYLLGLELEHSHPSENEVSTAITLTNIAHVYKQRGNMEAALEAYERAYLLQLRHMSTTDCRDEIVSTLSSIGLMNYHLKFYERAFVAYQEALRLIRESNGSDMQQASTLNSIGLVLFKQGKFDLCRDCFVACLQIRSKLYGPNHKDMAMVWYNLASVAFESGDDDSAIQWYEEALRIEKASLGEDHPDIIITLVHLGQVKQQCGLLEPARETYREALRSLYKQVKHDKLCEARLINLIGNCFLQEADIENLMDTYTAASRLLLENGWENDFLEIIGYNLYGLSRLCPVSAAAA